MSKFSQFAEKINFDQTYFWDVCLGGLARGFVRWFMFEVSLSGGFMPYNRENKALITTNVRQPWTNYVNNGNKHLIVGADVRSEYSNIRYIHLISGKAQKFVSGDKYDF